ncbi:uncharacterized protein [Palaemon carinicauda]|uniref:uncharacterized protein n=1 Tax=Palaemon carinicauda TaxID=392227 RepID=UPI0035B650B0
MKLRYDFQPSQKTYRTFPQKVVQSTGLLDRFDFLKWCCPFCLEKPRSQSRKSSGVPVIRITRPRSPDSDSDSDVEEETKRRDSVGSAGSAGSSTSLTKSQRNAHSCNKSGGDGAADAISLESSVGSGELDIINEEMDEAKDYDSESIESKESLRSKTSIHSKSSSTAKDKTSAKSKSSWRSKDKGSVGGDSKDSRKNSKESLRSSRDSVKDKDSQNEKTRSPMKKLIKHLKRTTSSPSPIGRSGDKRSASTRSTTSLEDDGGKGGGGGGGWRSGSKKFSFTSSSGDWRTRSATVDSRMKQASRDGKSDHKSATSEVIGQGVMKAKGDDARRSATLDKKVLKAMELAEVETDGNPAFKTTATWERKTNDVKTVGPTKAKRDGMIFSHPPSQWEENDSPVKNPEQPLRAPLPYKVNMSAERDDDDDDDDDDDEDDDITMKFKSAHKALRKDSGRETGSEMGLGENELGRTTEEDHKRGPSDHKEWDRCKRGKDAKGRGRKYYPDEDDGEEGGGETTESSPPETPAAKEHVYDSSSTKPSSGFEA